MKIQKMMDSIIKLEGTIYCILVDSDNGKLLASIEGNDWPLPLLAEKSAGIVQTERHAMRVLGKEREIAQELLFTMVDYLHVVTILPKNPRFYICTGLKRKQGNLALLRRISRDLVADLVIEE